MLPHRPLLAALLAPLLPAQSITPLVMEGDSVPGVGAVTDVAGFQISDTGEVLVHVITDNPDVNANAALLDGSGATIVAEGDTVADPPGATIRAFSYGEFSMTASGQVHLRLSLLGVPPGTEDGLYVGTDGTDRRVSTGDPVEVAGLPPGSTWQFLLPGILTDTDLLCYLGRIDDPSVPGAQDEMAFIVHSTTTGAETLVVAEGDVLPGQTEPIRDFALGAWAFNSAGQLLFGARTFAAIDVQNVIYLDDTKIAQTGDPSPWGSVYTSLVGSTHDLALNDAGDYIFRCKSGLLDGIVRNGTAFVRSGEPLPAIAPFTLDEFGQPLYIANDGRVLWMGSWDPPGPEEIWGLFLDYSLLVEAGLTTVGGETIASLSGLDRGYTISPNGRYILFEAVLESGLEGLFLIDLGA